MRFSLQEFLDTVEVATNLECDIEFYLISEEKQRTFKYHEIKTIYNEIYPEIESKGLLHALVQQVYITNSIIYITCTITD